MYFSRYYKHPSAVASYYSLGDVDIFVDIIRVPFANGQTKGSVAETVKLLNDHVAPYYKRISGNKLANIRF